MKIKELYSDKTKWTTRAFARDKQSRPIDILSEEAVSFCLMGAVEKCYGRYNEKAKIVERIQHYLMMNNYYNSITNYNDLIEKPLNLKIITFNYDLSLEYFLYSRFNLIPTFNKEQNTRG